MNYRTHLAHVFQRMLLARELKKVLKLTTLVEFEEFVSHLNPSRLFQLASAVAPAIELRLYPGWHFGVAETDATDKLTLLRIAIWRYCRQHKLQRSVILPWYNKLRVNAYLGNDISRLLFIDGYYEPNEFVFLASILNARNVFLDVGANDGLYSMFASKYVTDKGRVLAFEPS